MKLLPRYAERAGGYTRILNLSRTRIGDGAPQVIFELVESEAVEKVEAEAVSE